MIKWLDILSFCSVGILLIHLIVHTIFSRQEEKKIREIDRLLNERDKRVRQKADKEKRYHRPETFWNLN